MTEFRELQPFPQPRRYDELTPQAEHYKAFKSVWKQQEVARVVTVAFSPVTPNRLAVVSGTKVGIWQGAKGGVVENVSTLSKFKDMTECVAWRPDAKLMLAGEAGGSCAVVEMENKKVLRRFRGHEAAVTCCSFAAADKGRAATGARDGKLRLWDVATSDLLLTVDAHEDRMKVLEAGPGGPDVWITAGYDGKVHLWDLRVGNSKATGSPAPVATVNHGHPVECGAVFPGGALFASGGGTEVKLWDLASGGRLVQDLPNAHSKVVTSVCLDNSASSLLTASFDGLAKVYGAADFQHLYTYKLPGPATCASWRHDGKAMAFGLDDGRWILKEWKDAGAKHAADEAASEPIEAPVKSSIKRYIAMRGVKAPALSDDEIVEMDRPTKRRETNIDFFFRKFEYRKVAEYIVGPNRPGYSAGLAGFEELLQRGNLETALKEIGENQCLLTLRWLLKVFARGDAFHHQMFMEVLHTLLDFNKCLQPPCTQELVNFVDRIQKKIHSMLKAQEDIMLTSGMLKTVTTL